MSKVFSMIKEKRERKRESPIFSFLDHIKKIELITV